MVVMDNLACHKRAGVREAIEAAGAWLLYLPPCRPDFNPIEQAFSKLKALLRKACERTVGWLWRRIGRLSGEFDPRGCRGSPRAFRREATTPIVPLVPTPESGRVRCRAVIVHANH